MDALRANIVNGLSSMTKPPKARKAQERERKRAQGLIRREYWIYPNEHEKIAEYIKSIRKFHVKHS